jgi:methylated-DNA-[protein]-cysteine S-methyltransferase
MIQQLNYTIFNTDMGWVGMLASTKGLLVITLPQPSVHEVHQLLGNNINYAIWSPHLFRDLMERLKGYFGGQRTTFPDRLDLSQATHFQREVWEITRCIPYGETRSYAWVAEQIRTPRAARAVGSALGKNPLPVIVPCHRVVASDGKLGGFGGGVEMKRYLLSQEASASH